MDSSSCFRWVYNEMTTLQANYFTGHAKQRIAFLLCLCVWLSTEARVSDESAAATELSNCIFAQFQLMIHVSRIYLIALMRGTYTSTVIMHNQINSASGSLLAITVLLVLSKSIFFLQLAIVSDWLSKLAFSSNTVTFQHIYLHFSLTLYFYKSLNAYAKKYFRVQNIVMRLFANCYFLLKIWQLCLVLLA